MTTGELWATLLPLIIGGAAVPIQLIITILVLKSPRGLSAAAALVAGMITVRLLQGVLFGLVFGPSAETETTDAALDSNPGVIVSALLLVVAVLFFVTALKQIFAKVDEDAPPPAWMSMLDTITPTKAYLIGMGLMLIGAKFWVFTLGAISAIAEASLGTTQQVLTFLAFVLLSAAPFLAILAVQAVLPKQADAILSAAVAWLQRHNRIIMIAIGLTFGSWFLVKALSGLGVL